MPTRRPACGADRGVREHNEAAALALRPSVDSTIQRDAARPPPKQRGTLGSVSLPGYTEAERNHVVCGVDYASLMLVDVVAIPPSGSPFFKFVQDNPVCSTNSRDRSPRDRSRLYQQCKQWRVARRRWLAGRAARSSLRVLQKCRYVSKPGLDWDVVGGRLYSHAVLRIEREIV